MPAKFCVVVGCKTTHDRSVIPSCPTSSHSLAAEDSHPRQRDVFFLRGIGSLSSSSSPALRICTACYNFAKNRVHFQPVHKPPSEELSAVDLIRLTSVEFFLEHILPTAGCTVIFRVLSELRKLLPHELPPPIVEAIDTVLRLCSEADTPTDSAALAAHARMLEVARMPQEGNRPLVGWACCPALSRPLVALYNAQHQLLIGQAALVYADHLKWLETAAPQSGGLALPRASSRARFYKKQPCKML